MVIPQGRGIGERKWEVERCCLIGMESQICKVKKVLEFHCTTMKI